MHSNFVDLNPKFTRELNRKNDKNQLIQFKLNLEQKKKEDFYKFIMAGNRLTSEELNKLDPEMRDEYYKKIMMDSNAMEDYINNAIG